MFKVRGKFKVVAVTRRDWNPEAAEVELKAQYTGSPEDNTYSAATPNASISMSITNPSAILELGKYYYVDFTLVE